MTPWERLDAEIARKRSSWSSLAAQLDVKKQAVGNWKARGIPAKHMRAAAAFVGKSMDWLEFGEDDDEVDQSAASVPVDQPAPKREHTMGIDLANLFDQLPDDRAIRADIFVRCYQIIAPAVQRIASTPTHTPEPHATPRKLGV